MFLLRFGKVTDVDWRHESYEDFGMDKRLEKIFDENLRERPSDPVGLREYTKELVQALEGESDPKKRVSLLGELGVHLRSLEDLDDAEKSLLEALQIIKENNLGIGREVQQKIRLAHVYQWKKSFKISDALFTEVIEVCRANSEVSRYLAFALQHSGKNQFDQGKLREALSLFEEALVIRMKENAPEDQLESTKLAVRRTKVLLGE
jgi:tetratricopeptide (TPR) repeat protein